MESSGSRLMLAILCDDCAEVAKLLDKGVDINYIEPTGYSPLHAAIEKGNLEIVELLLKRNANVNRFSQYVLPPLHLAVVCGRLDVLTLLIACGASLETKSISGLLPIHIAAQKGHLDIVEYFVDNKLYHVDACSSDLRTPLIWAVIEGQKEVAEYLIQCNADVKKADVFDSIALHYACESNHEDIEIIEIFISKGSNLDAKTYSGETPLHICVKQGYLSAARRLIESGARSYLERGASGNSPIHLAAQYNQTEMLEYFFKMGISVNFQTVDGYSLLHVAAIFGRSQMVTFLLQKGANIEGKIVSRGTTALHLASSSNHCDVIQVLLNKRADVMAIDKKGRIPLDFVYEHFNGDPNEIRRFDMKCSMELLVKHMLLFYKDIEVPTPSNFPSGTSIDEFKHNCQEEIEQIKTCLIGNTTVSLYTFLQALRNKNKLLNFLRNHELQEEMKNIKQYIDKYPIYSSFLPMVLEEVHNGKERLLLLEKADTAMDIIVPKLVLECKIHILQMLNNEDLSSLIESVKVEFY
ncbi:ankyrin-1 isoform X2 [Diabrotica virgifera virgifera]|uniref:Ankyrin-1-like isoform X2 n=1 Tax=Diabrotica virgifera virgifera TaxID=50390 RepID=A0A6P7GRM4_DIAVI|nr:ankyrin-1 isoform X2 [Diabrotica virgifera virgifera]